MEYLIYWEFHDWICCTLTLSLEFTELLGVTGTPEFNNLDVSVMGRRRNAEHWWIIWFRRNHLPFSVNVTRETVANLRRKRTAAQPIFILGQDDDVQVFVVHTDNKLTNTQAV